MYAMTKQDFPNKSVSLFPEPVSFGDAWFTVVEPSQ